MNILVIDAGTSSMRGILFSETGSVLREHHAAYSPRYLENGWVEQDPSDWKNALLRVVGAVCGQAKETGETVDAVALTSQRSSVIPVNRQARPLSPAIMWQDKRTNELCAGLSAWDEEIFSHCGAKANPVFSGVKMAWIRENRPELYEKAYKLLVIPDYLIYQMTGELCTDHTYGSRSLLMDLRGRRWDPWLLELFQIDKDKLCPLIEPGSVCGRVTEDFAEMTGCPAGIPVVTAGGDQQCGALGQGVVREGMLSITAGTGGFLTAASSTVPQGLRPDVICNCSAVPGQYVLESSVLTCCSAFDWFRKEFYGDLGLKELDAIAEKTPMGANGCMCLPYFQGRSTPDWNHEARAVFSGITLAVSRADMLRALLEGICYEIGNGIDTIGRYVEISQVYINGGMTNSEPFNRIQCDVYGRRLIRQGRADATARGALMVAGTALGLYGSVEEAAEAVGLGENTKEYLPQTEAVLFYKEEREKMNRLYEKLWG